MTDHKSTSAAQPGITFADILYVLFRHKWKIGIICAIGVVAAVVAAVLAKPRYESEAKLLIKYVVQAQSPPHLGASEATVQQVDDSGANVLNTELQILTSMDLALQVADAVGPAKILAKAGGGNDRFAAAGLIQSSKNLTVEAVKKSNVIRVAFQHPEADVARTVLSQLIDSYIKKHAEIHRGGGFDDFLTAETQQLHTRLLLTEEALRTQKSKLGVASFEQAKKQCTEQLAEIQQKIFDAEAELAQREAAAKEIVTLQRPDAKLQTNASAVTNSYSVSPEKAAEYSRVRALLESLNKREEDLLVYLTPTNSLVAAVQEQIRQNQELKRQLEEQIPGLKMLEMSGKKGSADDNVSGTRTDPVVAMAEAAGLRARIEVLTNRLAEVQARAVALEEAESSISELERQRALDEGYYTNFSQSLEQSRINERLGAGKVSNISVIQSASAPFRVASKLRKIIAGILFGSLGGAVALAFLIEFLVDQSVRRPAEIGTKLGLPLFITVPHFDLNGQALAPAAETRVPLLTDQKESEDELLETSQGRGISPQTNGMEIVPWDASHTLRPFSEALRDRLMTYFEQKNLTHKPKLVAVTGCAPGSGVSTIASGLAASLSETGEGNVLLVDMNQEQGAAHYFHHGDLACNIDDALASERRDNALVQENLYVVTEAPNGETISSIMPKRFKSLIPRLAASDFDYIIFDMPPVNQVSLTPRLARFMDMVLMVVESGKTARGVAQQAGAMLSESNANVGVVLNKTRSYIPTWLHEEF